MWKRDRKLFTWGALIGGTCLSIALASVPHNSTVTDDTALYQNLSEIRVQKDAPPDFDRDLQRLSQIESRYRENLPLNGQTAARLRGPIARVSKKKYRPAGATYYTQ